MSARFGIPRLDDLLEGLFWGENVAWVVGEEDWRVVPGILGAASRAEVYKQRVWVHVAGAEPAPDGSGDFSRVEVEIEVPGAEGLRQIDEICDSCERSLIAVDMRGWDAAHLELGATQAIVGQLARRVLQRNVVAFWFLPAGTDQTELAERIKDLSQCVIEVHAGELKIERADARRPEARGAILAYHFDQGCLDVTKISVASLLGRGLRAVRQERGWSQTDLARMVGVSHSAISQAERGRHALSLEIVLDLAQKLGVTVDQLVRGRQASYEVTRAHRLVQASGAHSPILVDDRRIGVRVVLVRVPPRGTASPSLSGRGPQVLLVGRGLVQAIMTAERPVLREGDALTVWEDVVQGCRNLGKEEALVFWLARDTSQTAP